MKIMLLFLGISLLVVGPAPEQAALMEEKPCELKGQVFIETTEAFADFTIFLVDNPQFADFSVFYTDFRGDVGCK